MTKYHSTRRIARDKLNVAHAKLTGACEDMTMVAYWYKDEHPEVTDALTQIIEHTEQLTELLSSLGANL